MCPSVCLCVCLCIRSLFCVCVYARMCWARVRVCLLKASTHTNTNTESILHPPPLNPHKAPHPKRVTPHPSGTTRKRSNNTAQKRRKTHVAVARVSRCRATLGVISIDRFGRFRVYASVALFFCCFFSSFHSVSSALVIVPTRVIANV